MKKAFLTLTFLNAYLTMLSAGAILL